MKGTVLEKIVQDKAIWVEARQQQQPLSTFQNSIEPASRHFYDALQGARTAFILECKRPLPRKALFVRISIQPPLPGSTATTLPRYLC